MNVKNVSRRLTVLLAVVVLLMAMVAPAFAQRSFGRGGSFGGGRSFGSSRSYSGGGGFFGGGQRRSGGSFGGGGSFGNSGSVRSAPSYPSRSSGGFGGRSSNSSFGRSGQFGGSGHVNSTSFSRLPPSYRGYSYSSPTRIYVNGGYYPSYGYGGFWSGYSLGMLSSPWYYHWMPFHPAFYVDAPYYDGGAYYAGGFSFTRFIFGMILLAIIVWFIARIFRGGGNRVRYTVSR
jgi:hypothetical protein